MRSRGEAAGRARRTGRPDRRRLEALAAGLGAVSLALYAAACARAPVPPPARPTILLITLDTTRADSVQPESTRVATPHLAGLAAAGMRFTQAYSTAPTTLPAHASMLTGLYPAGHGVHENARRLAGRHALLPELLAELGYASAAFVSGYPLERQFGLARGFDPYDDQFGANALERSAAATTERALAHLRGAGPGPLFVWVHYYDPHEPYAPPPAHAARYPGDPYLGEIAAMDEQVGRLVEGFRARPSPGGLAVLIAGDHGESRGEHGEMLHGNLLYQGAMRVPLLLVGSGVQPAVRSDPVSIRQVLPTILEWAGTEQRTGSLLTAPASGAAADPVLGEAMQPFLQYRWQPQVMAVLGRFKVIRSGRLEVYDLAADPGETRDLAGTVEVERTLRQAVSEYPLPAGVPASDAANQGEFDAEARRRLASLGYVAGESTAPARPDAPRAADMSPLFADLDAGSRLFVQEDYRAAIPIFERVLRRDPGNAIVAVRLAVAHSLLGRDREALDYFSRARSIDAESLDVRHYLAIHELRHGRFDQAAALFEAVLAGQPDRLPAIDGLAQIREREGRLPEAIALHEKAAAVARDPAPHLLQIGELRMGLGESAAAIRAFERARELQGEQFQGFLQLGVLYLAERRLPEARAALDRVLPAHPGYPMALFKRAQVSVLLQEADRVDRVRAAWEGADPQTRALVERERLFAGLLPH